MCHCQWKSIAINNDKRMRPSCLYSHTMSILNDILMLKSVFTDINNIWWVPSAEKDWLALLEHKGLNKVFLTVRVAESQLTKITISMLNALIIVFYYRVEK